MITIIIIIIIIIIITYQYEISELWLTVNPRPTGSMWVFRWDL